MIGEAAMTDQDNLRDRIAEVVHDENERLRSENGTRYTSLRYDELPDIHRENRESIAQAIIDELRTDEAVARLANFLHNDDVGETLNEHEESCRMPDCNERDLYVEYAHAAINALLGEEPCHP